MSSKPEVKTEERAQGERPARGARGGRGGNRDSGRNHEQKSEYQLKGQENPKKTEGGQDGQKRQHPRESKDGEGKPRERNHDRKPREGKDGERRPRTEGEGAPRRERKERPKREFDPDWKKKITVTLDTEIPPLPKEEPQKPDKEKLTHNLDECDRKIEQYEAEIEKLMNTRKAWREKEKEKREKERAARLENREQQKKEFDGNKHLFEDHKVLKKDVEEISKTKKEVDTKLSDVQSRMMELEKQFLTKSAMSLEDVKEQIANLERRQMSERMTGLEEKKLIADLEVLKKSIPIAEQYSKLLAEKKKIKTERDVISKKLKPLLDQKKDLGNEIKDILEKRKAEEAANPAPPKKDGEKEGKEGGEKTKPKHDDPYSKKIDEFIEFKKQMRTKKNKLRDEFDSNWDKYHEQKFERMKIEHMMREKEYLRRNDEYNQRRAKERRQELIDEFLSKNTPKEDASTEFEKETAACDLLVSYLTSILPENKRLFALESLNEDETVTEEDLKARLQADSKLKGLKVTALPKKEQITHGGQSLKKKKGDKKQKKDEPKQKDDAAAEDQFDPEAKIIFDIQIRNAFSQIKLDPPTVNKEINDSIKAVEAKKAEVDKAIEKRAAEIASLKDTAEKEVPSLAQLIEEFRSQPREKGEKGSHGHKDRRGARGGRASGRDVQWHGARDRHPKREGDQEVIKENEELYEGDEDSFEAEKKNIEKKKHIPKAAKISETDFPAL